MTDSTPPAARPGANRTTRLEWMPKFLAELENGASVLRAATAAGIRSTSAYSAKGNHPDFAAAWQAAVDRQRQQPAGPGTACVPEPLRPHWRTRFIEALAETSNVRLSAEQAGIPWRLAYKTRRSEPEFAARWNAALLEGYEHLEMEVLGYLRSPNPERKLDVTAALRLLTAHRETVLRLKALTEEEDEQATIDALDRWIDEMRVRRTANQAILSEAEGSDGPE